jgi:hypothetical protein
MKLLWILYKSQKGDKHILFLSFGVYDEYYIGLDARLVSDRDRNIILTNHTFPQLSLGAKIEFLKNKCPETMKNAYRKLSKSKIVSMSEYKMGK